MVNIKQIMLILLMLVASLSAAHALGIGPAKIEINYKPNSSDTYAFIVVNDPDAERGIDLYIDGDKEAAKYTTLSATGARLAPKEIRQFYFTTNFTDALTPGQHKLRIGAVESTARPGFVGARIGAEIIVLIEVPIPGKYIIIDDFSATDVKVGQQLPISLRLTNRGNATIKTITSAVELVSISGQKVATAILSYSNLEPASTATLSTEIKTNNILAGKYNAKAEIDYDRVRTSIERQLRIGELHINILQVNGDDIKKNSIGKILIQYESEWNDPIEHVVPRVELLKAGDVVAQTQGQEFLVGSFGNGISTIFLDANGLEAGEYDIKGILDYENKTAIKTGKIKIVSFEISWVLAVALVVLIAILLSRTTLFKKRR